MWHVKNKNRMHHKTERIRGMGNADKVIADQRLSKTPPHFGPVVQPVLSHGQMPPYANSAYSSHEMVRPSQRPIPTPRLRKTVGSSSDNYHEASWSPKPIVKSGKYFTHIEHSFMLCLQLKRISGTFHH